VDQVGLEARIHTVGILVNGDHGIEGPRLRPLRDDQLSAANPRFGGCVQKVFLRYGLNAGKQEQHGCGSAQYELYP
jgi:hypothetical protein